MIYRTHTAFSGSIVLAPVFLPLDINPFYQLPIETFIYSFFIIVVFSLMPDLDEPESYLSRRFPFVIVSHILAAFTKHRGLTHNFVFTICLFLFLLITSIPYHNSIQDFYFLFYVALVSYTGHMIGDGMTIGGIKRALYPFSKSTYWTVPKFMRFKTDSLFEHTLFYFIIFPFFSFQIFYFLYINNYIETYFNIKLPF